MELLYGRPSLAALSRSGILTCALTGGRGGRPYKTGLNDAPYQIVVLSLGYLDGDKVAHSRFDALGHVIDQY